MCPFYLLVLFLAGPVAPPPSSSVVNNVSHFHIDESTFRRSKTHKGRQRVCQIVDLFYLCRRRLTCLQSSCEGAKSRQYISAIYPRYLGREMWKGLEFDLLSRRVLTKKRKTKIYGDHSYWRSICSLVCLARQVFWIDDGPHRWLWSHC